MAERDPHQPMNPWHGGSFDLPDEPTDGEIRRAISVVAMGGSLGGSTTWGFACVRWLRDLGPDEGDEAAAAYRRVASIGKALQPPPTGVLNKAGRGLARPQRAGRVGDIVPAGASDDDIRRLYSPRDAEAILTFRRQLEDLAGTDA